MNEATAQAIATVIAPLVSRWDPSAKPKVWSLRGRDKIEIAIVQGSTATLLFQTPEEIAAWIAEVLR